MSERTNNPNDEPHAAPPVGVEPSGVSTPAIVKFTIGMSIGIVVSMLLIWALLRLWAALEPGPPRPISRVARRAEERTPPPPHLLSGTGLRVKPEELTSDPLIQKSLTEDELNYELEYPEEYREVLDRVKERELSSYGVIQQPATQLPRQTPDQSANQPPVEFRIPINEAKRLLIERLQQNPQPAPTPALPATPAETNDQSPTAASAGRVYERRRR